MDSKEVMHRSLAAAPELTPDEHGFFGSDPAA
jgi:hypothetical protein